MIKQLGTKIYYCTLTGNILNIIGDMYGYVKETTFDEDYETYSNLKNRNKESIDLIQLDYGEYSKLSNKSTGVRVNLETKELEFTYEELPPTPQKPTQIEILQNKISVLEEGLQSVLSGDMQSLAYILYPEDFTDVNNTTLEL